MITAADIDRLVAQCTALNASFRLELTTTAVRGSYLVGSCAFVLEYALPADEWFALMTIERVLQACLLELENGR